MLDKSVMTELCYTAILRVRLEYKELCTSTNELKENKTKRYNKLVSSFYIIHAVALD